MALCRVEMWRSVKGGCRPELIEGDSLFDAADKYVQGIWMLWEYDSCALLQVTLGDQVWYVSQDRLREWRAKR